MKMKLNLWIAVLIIASGMTTAFAADIYTFRVDGLACPYCAYGIEKKLKELDGVVHDSIRVDLEEGVVSVKVTEGTTLTDEQMKTLFNDAGFTFRGMMKKPADE